MRLVILVTPHVGVWIETLNTDKQQLENMVTPHVGVWIETVDYSGIAQGLGHTSCRCVD